MVGSSEDPVQIIQRAAEKHIKVVLIAEDGPTVEHSVRKVNVYEVRGPRYSPPDPFPISRSQEVRTRKHTGKGLNR